MLNEIPITIQHWRADMDRSWRALQEVVDAADRDALTQKTDPAGWSAKDHLAHLDAWANSVVVMIRDGQPQWIALGIDEELFLEEGYDRENEAIRQHTIDTPLDEVLAHFRQTHEEILRLVGGMTDEDISQPCNMFVPGSGDFAIAHKIHGNTADHYDEHRKYIERILQG